MPPLLRISFSVEYIFANETGPDATRVSVPLMLFVPAGLRSDRWTATPAPYLRACDTNLHDASIPSLPSIESSTLKIVHDTGRRVFGLSIHDWTRPVLAILLAIYMSECKFGFL